MEERVQWFHCRSCGEEGLTPEDERCPLCGIHAPVTLCDACHLPIREDEPWTIQRIHNDLPGKDERNYAFHEACYPSARRRLMRRYRTPDWQLLRDARDPYEPLSPARLALGVGLLCTAVFICVWMVATSPPSQSVLAPETLRAIERDSGPMAEWTRRWLTRRPLLPKLRDILTFTLMTAAAVWLIQWGLSRRRPIFFEGMKDEDFPRFG